LVPRQPLNRVEIDRAQRALDVVSPEEFNDQVELRGVAHVVDAIHERDAQLRFPRPHQGIEPRRVALGDRHYLRVLHSHVARAGSLSTPGSPVVPAGTMVRVTPRIVIRSPGSGATASVVARISTRTSSAATSPFARCPVEYMSSIALHG